MPSSDGRSTRRGAAVCALWVLALFVAAAPYAGAVPVTAGQRYAMGTMFDVVVYHEPREAAARAVGWALDEIARLDRVMSHFDPHSDLWALLRAVRGGAVRVDASLYEVIEASLDVSRRSGGTFDVTVAPLVRAYRAARGAGREPAAGELEAARACVGYERIALVPPDRVRLDGECLEIDLGGIGKGYAVDRALALLRDAGIRHAVVNAGGSSIGAIGTPPGRAGWPILLGDAGGEQATILRDRTVSVSQAAPSMTGDELVDPRAGAAARRRPGVRVFAPTATVSDALATTLALLSAAEGARLLAQFDDVSAEWVSPSGAVEASCCLPESGLAGLQRQP